MLTKIWSSSGFFIKILSNSKKKICLSQEFENASLKKFSANPNVPMYYQQVNVYCIRRAAPVCRTELAESGLGYRWKSASWLVTYYKRNTRGDDRPLTVQSADHVTGLRRGELIAQRVAYHFWGPKSSLFASERHRCE